MSAFNMPPFLFLFRLFFFTFFLLLFSFGCDQDAVDLPVNGYARVYKVQFNLEEQCSSNFSLPSQFETQLKLSSPLPTTSLAEQISLGAESSISSLSENESPSKDVLVEAIFSLLESNTSILPPTLFQNLNLKGQTCTQEEKSFLCLRGYQDLQFQHALHSTQSDFPFSTCSVSAFFPKPSEWTFDSDIDLDQIGTQFEQLWTESPNPLGDSSLCCPDASISSSLSQERSAFYLEKRSSDQDAPLEGLLSGQIQFKAIVDPNSGQAFDLNLTKVCSTTPSCSFKYRVEATVLNVFETR